jgi:transposase
MAKAYGDDLRRKFLAAYDRGDGTLEQLAEDFSVSLGWAKKISAMRARSGRVERTLHRPGRKAMVGEEQRKMLQAWLAAEPGLTLAELQFRLDQQAGVKVSLVCIWQWMRRLGLRLKRSHNTRRSIPIQNLPTPIRSVPTMSAQSSNVA